jgi:hypothetical protein
MDVESVAGHLLPAGGVFGFLAARRDELFPDALFADLFRSGRGRPGVPAPVVATVLVLPALHGLSDREAAEAVTFDLRWKAACGLPVTAAVFHPTVLLDDAVATRDTVTRLVAAVRRVARRVPGGAGLVAAAATRSGHDYTTAGKPAIAGDDAAARQVLVDGLAGDAHAVPAALTAAGPVPRRARGRRGRAAGPGRRSGRRARAGPRRPRRGGPVADRPAGRHRPGDLHCGPRRAARTQDGVPPPGRVQGPCRGRARHLRSSPPAR